jgi:hypothetical protein
MECLNLDNAKQQNLMRKKSRTMTEKPEGELKQELKRPAAPIKTTPVTVGNKENVVKVTANE